MYLLTVVSSALKASTVLEDAMMTYAILLMSAYEVSLKQLETVIAASHIPHRQAEILTMCESFTGMSLNHLRTTKLKK